MNIGIKTVHINPNKMNDPKYFENIEQPNDLRNKINPNKQIKAT